MLFIGNILLSPGKITSYSFKSAKNNGYNPEVMKSCGFPAA